MLCQYRGRGHPTCSIDNRGDVQVEEERLGKIKLSQPADPMRWLFQLSQDVARYNAQFAMRAVLDFLGVCFE